MLRLLTRVCIWLKYAILLYIPVALHSAVSGVAWRYRRWRQTPEARDAELRDVMARATVFIAAWEAEHGELQK